MPKFSLCHLPGDGTAGAPEDVGAHSEADLPVAGVDVGGLVLGQHGSTVDVSLTVQQGESAPVLHVENGSHL